MNDLSAGSALMKPTDFDTFHLTDAQPSLFIATPVLKRYDSVVLPGAEPSAARDSALGKERATPPDGRKLYYLYGGYWMAKFVSPGDVGDPPYHSTNQEPMVSTADLHVDDWVFLRPTQSEHVMLQFGDLRVVQNGAFVDTWPVFHQTV
jgi:D-serine deaminase-like pyridoxal phosphate-dependent protein